MSTPGANPTPFTFAVPFFAREREQMDRHLRQLIESVRAQSFSDWRMLIVDDRSPLSGVAEFVEAFRDSRIQYLRNESNLGPLANWNRCVDLVETPYFCVPEASDILRPSYLLSVLDSFAHHAKACAVFCRAEEIDDEDHRVWTLAPLLHAVVRPSRVYRLQNETGLTQLLRGNWVVASSVAYRKELLGDLRRPLDPRFALLGDYAFWATLMLEGRQMVGIPDVLLRHRAPGRDGFNREQIDAQFLQEESALFDWLAQECEARAWIDAARAARQKQVLKFKALYRAGGDLVRGRWQGARDKWDFWRALRSTR